MAKRYHCSCCGTEFEEPNGVFEKLRCPVCDAVEGHGTIEGIEDVKGNQLGNS